MNILPCKQTLCNPETGKLLCALFWKSKQNLHGSTGCVLLKAEVVSGDSIGTAVITRSNTTVHVQHLTQSGGI